MADDDKKKAPIIIKRIKKGGHGHHGGAWKVAYADFVTAMMAFFLLLWLLSSAPQETLHGIADYFQPTIGVKDAKGIGFDGGTSPDEKDGTSKNSASPTPPIVFGAQQSGPIIKNPDDEPLEEEKEEQRLIKVQDQIKEQISQDLKEYRDQIIVEMTPEGLRIQIIDAQNRPMFKEGTAVMEEHFKKILANVTDFIRGVPNYISVTGHTDSNWGSSKEYNNWELSADRANASRRFMVEHKFPAERLAWVVGKADREPLVPEKPQDISNRRVSIMLLKRNALPKHLQTAPEKLFMENQPAKDDSMLKFDQVPLDRNITKEAQ